MKIDTPTLKEHSEDIPQIAMHFLRYYGRLFHKRVVGIEPDALNFLAGLSLAR